jgi:hypothetical protein
LAKQPTCCKEEQDKKTTSTPEAIAHYLIIGSIYRHFSAKPVNAKIECREAVSGQNPKSESRNPKQIRIPKFENIISMPSFRISKAGTPTAASNVL